MDDAVAAIGSLASTPGASRSAGRLIAAVGLAASISIFLLLGAGYALNREIDALVNAEILVDHARHVQLDLTQLLAALEEAEYAQRSFVLSGDPSSLKTYYEDATAVIPRLTTEMQDLTADDPHQHANLDQLRPLLDERLRIMQARIAARRDNRDQSTTGIQAGQGKVIMDRIRTMIAGMNTEEEALLTNRQHVEDAKVAQVRRLAAGLAGTALLLLCSVFAWLAIALHRRGIAERSALELAARLDRRQKELTQALAERDAAEAERSKRELQLHRAQNLSSVGRLAGGLAHVLNNALTVVIGYAELIGMTVKGDRDVSSAAEEISRSATRAAGMAQQFLSFSQRQRLQPQTAELNDLLHQLKEFAAPLLGQRIDLQMELAPGPCLIFVDRQQFLTALLNLVTNACEAMPEGGRLTLSAACPGVKKAEASMTGGTLAAADQAEIRLADTGSGMTPEVREHAFEPFFSTKDPSQGAGLGLSTVHGFIHQSGGQISLESEPGRGTTVRILLPVAQAERTFAPAAA
jgi:signal transduction histidine kinase